MTVRAVPSSRRGPNRRTLCVTFAAAAGLIPTPAFAQLGAVVSVYSDDRFRGVSLSGGRPVALLDLSYDSPDGLYGALSGSLVASRDGVKPLGITLDGGFSRRLDSGLNIDVGAVHSAYAHYSRLAPQRSYTEVYGGVSGRILGARLSISPDYLGPAHWTLHGSVNAHKALSNRLFVEAEVGALVPVGSYRQHLLPAIDARVAIARRTGRVTFHAAVTARGGSYSYAGRRGAPIGLVVGISSAL